MPFVDPCEIPPRASRRWGKPTGSYVLAHPTQDHIAISSASLQRAWFDQLRLVVDYRASNADNSIPSNAGPHW